MRGSLLVFAATAVLALVAAAYSPSDPKADHFAAAVAADERGDVAGAAAAFTALAQFSPSSEAFNNLGVTLLDAAELERGAAAKEAVLKRALAALQQALKLNPANADAKASLAEPALLRLQRAAAGGDESGGAAVGHSGMQYADYTELATYLQQWRFADAKALCEKLEFVHPEMTVPDFRTRRCSRRCVC